MVANFDIVIPTFNASSTISYVLDSLVQQTDSNFSVILVDDASTDNTVEIAQRFIHKLNLTSINKAS